MEYLTIKNVGIKKKFIEVEFVEIDGKEIILTHIPYGTIESYLTHVNCEKCSAEFKKIHRYSKFCKTCQDQNTRENFFKKPLAPKDYSGMIYDENLDKYFYTVEDVLIYYEEDELSLEEARLLTTYPSSFGSIDIDKIAEDQVHDDWDPSDELLAKIDEFNEYLSSISTNTVFPSDQRIDISEYLK